MKSHFNGKPDTRLYAIMPARAIQDDELHATSLRVLGALCLHSNKHGICWPSRITVGRHIGKSTSTVSRHYGRLVKAGYLRRLQGKAYPVPRRQPGRWYTARFQILYEGVETPMPTYEQFISPKPRVVAELDEAPVEEAADKSKGVRGMQAKSLAQAFVSGVAAASGVHRTAEPSLRAAATLAEQGVDAEAVRDYAMQMTLEALKARRQPPLTLNQVVQWAGLG